MPIFKLHLRRQNAVEPDDDGMHFPDLDHAYLAACAAVADTARELIIDGQDPISAAFLICDEAGRQLMEVPFSDVLRPSAWGARRVSRSPLRMPRSVSTRDNMALRSFRLMFDHANAGCVLMTPELQIVEMNVFGARHSHVDPEAIRGQSILDIFDLAGKAKKDFSSFMRLAQQGKVSEIIDMPYLVLDASEQTVDGWWTARTWPIFDDDGNILGLVEWAEPSAAASNHGHTLLRVGNDRKAC